MFIRRIEHNRASAVGQESRRVDVNGSAIGYRHWRGTPSERTVTFNSILVDVDATADAQPAVDRAVRIARASGGRLRIVDVVPAEKCARIGSETDVEENIYGHRRERLAQLASGIRDVAVDWRLLTGPPAAALVDEVRRSGHDLIMRLHSRDLIVRLPQDLRGVDAHLIRTCPCPVWALGYGAPSARPHVVAAVSGPLNEDDDDTRNGAIVEMARRIAQVENGSVTLLHAWTAFAENKVGAQTSNHDFAAYLDDTRRRLERRLVKLLASSQDNVRVRLELRHGDPEHVISDYVIRHGIDVVVAGTSVRGPIARCVFGSTTDRLLRTLPCSIVVPNAPGRCGP